MARDVETGKEKRWLKVMFTEEQWAEHASSLAAAVKELGKARTDKSVAMKAWTDKIGGISDNVERLRGYVETKSKMDDVECTVAKDYASNEYRVTRNDTGEVIESRALTPDEKQRSLGL